MFDVFMGKERVLYFIERKNAELQFSVISLSLGCNDMAKLLDQREDRES